MEITNNKNITFCALKKSRLTAIEKVFAETFKPPLEKMEKVEDLHKWSHDCFVAEVSKKTDQKGIQDMLDLWSGQILKTLSQVKDNNLWKLFIYKSIQKNDIYAPEFNPQIIKVTIKQITEMVENTHDRFNFMKHYERNLQNIAIGKYFKDSEIPNGWLKFSKSDDVEETNEIIRDIRNLSIGTKWCTKSSMFAQECLDAGDFYILFKDGKPMLGVRSHNNKIYEIKNKLNKPEYQSFTKDIEILLEQNPLLEKYKDSVSIWDMF